MLLCEDCRVRAGDFLLRLDRFALARGEHCLVIGPSGAGKSLLLRTIAGLVRPESGWILLRGEETSTLPPEARRIGLVFQHYSLFPHLSVLDNVAFGLSMRGVGRRQRHHEAASMLDRLGCAGLRDRLPGTLSGGEQQRVAIARALVAGADLLLLDEPFAALDPGTRAICRAELRQLRRTLDLTVLEVTHAPDEAAPGADRVAVLDCGELVADGMYAALVDRPPDLRTARALGVANLLPEGLIEPGVGGWCTVPTASISIVGPSEAPYATEDRVLRGDVETVEPLGPVCRVRLRVEAPGGQASITGFARPEVGASLSAGLPACAVFPNAAVHRFG